MGVLIIMIQSALPKCKVCTGGEIGRSLETHHGLVSRRRGEGLKARNTHTHMIVGSMLSRHNQPDHTFFLDERREESDF